MPKCDNCKNLLVTKEGIFCPKIDKKFENGYDMVDKNEECKFYEKK